MKHDPRGITTAMQLYFSGESLRNVAKSLRLLGMEVTHQTVYNWITKYTNLMQKYLDKITPQVGDIWRADEVFIKIRGDMKYLFALMDDESRFLIAQEVADTKHAHDATNLFRMGKEVTQTKPAIIITDGLRSYHDAYMKEFHARAQPRTTHIRNITLRGEKNNNKMERLNGEIRDREKVMRGLKKKDTVILKGYQLFHNYIRSHQGLEGQTPADKAGIKIEGDNKWITLIQNSSRNKVSQ
jgi:transposase-like protein